MDPCPLSADMQGMHRPRVRQYRHRRALRRYRCSTQSSQGSPFSGPWPTEPSVFRRARVTGLEHDGRCEKAYVWLLVLGRGFRFRTPRLGCDGRLLVPGITGFSHAPFDAAARLSRREARTPLHEKRCGPRSSDTAQGASGVRVSRYKSASGTLRGSSRMRRSRVPVVGKMYIPASSSFHFFHHRSPPSIA